MVLESTGSQLLPVKGPLAREQVPESTSKHCLRGQALHWEHLPSLHMGSLSQGQLSWGYQQVECLAVAEVA